ncbi:hypothetical protein [Winogradskyella sp. PG-2]|uniref:hypothetical protein n=1 Tax=Winogradskyella sp. PG-2 TaxID=754409 RepID=UPI000458717A|nr:hypothetical protein [Winogradskyella sp. PG-2]BAO76195.1 glycosyl transferase, group 1 [Winogradskyella sp. PG-2]
MQNLLFITTSSLAANPRLVKEFASLKAYYRCYVICFRHEDWSLHLSDNIKALHTDVQFIEIDRKKTLLKTILAKIKHKFSIVINPLFKTNYKVCAYASNDKAPQLVSYVNKLKRKHQFYKVIAHNLGAFYPAFKIAKHQKIGLQLDIEDFYPGEALYFNKALEKDNRHLIMQQSFNNAIAITYASKGIEKQCNTLYSIQPGIKQLTVINAFESRDFNKPRVHKSKTIKCVWFSQHIGPNRGLEQVFEAAKKHPEFQFHLIGNQNQDYLSGKTISSNIKFHDIMPQSELHKMLSTMDIGLALERKDADLNRDICLTNKFLAYAQAGLYILATNTFGQRDFLKALNYLAGEIIMDSLSQSLAQLNTKHLSYENRLHRWQQAKSFSWQNEEIKLLKLLE